MNSLRSASLTPTGSPFCLTQPLAATSRSPALTNRCVDSVTFIILHTGDSGVMKVTSFVLKLQLLHDLVHGMGT